MRARAAPPLGACAALALAALVAPVESRAALYKCLGADGSTTYTQIPCPAEATLGGVFSSGASGPPTDCRVARHWFSRVAGALERGAGLRGVTADLAGGERLSPALTQANTYLYAFEGTATPRARATALAMTRCEAGTFGKMGCDAFPQAFLGPLGGCAAAAGAAVPDAAPAAAMPDRTRAPGEAGRETGRADPAADRARAAARQAEARRGIDERREACAARAQARIDDANARSRAISSARAQDRIRAELRAARADRHACRALR